MGLGFEAQGEELKFRFGVGGVDSVGDWGLGLGDWGFELRVWFLNSWGRAAGCWMRCRVQDSGFRICSFSFGFRISGFGFRFRVWGIRFRISGADRRPERAEAGSEFPARFLRGEVGRGDPAPREYLVLISTIHLISFVGRRKL